MPSMKTCNYVIALITAVVGFVIAYTAYGYGIEMSMFGPGSGVWPFMLGSGLVVIAALIVVDTLKHSEEFASQTVVFRSPGCTSVYKMMVLVLIYVALFPLIGFYLASTLYMLVAVRQLGFKRIPVALGITLIFMLAIYAMFTLALHIQLPLPFFME